MKTLLVVDSSGRNKRSITRRLTRMYADQWQTTHRAGRVLHRDVGQNPPSPVDDAWVASAFASPESRNASMREALTLSEELLNEIEAADAIVLGVPMYNFGIPAQLKAYFDQIIRVNRSFSFNPRAEQPYQPLLADKPTTVIVSAGDGSLLPGEEMAHLNFLEPHLVNLLGIIGLHSLEFVRVGYEVYQDHRLKDALERAEAAVHRLAAGESAVPQSGRTVEETV